MSEIHLADTFGPIFGMDQMCGGTIPADLGVGDLVRLVSSGDDSIELRIAAIDVHRSPDGTFKEIVGIGLRGKNAERVSAGDVLQVLERPEEVDRTKPLE